MAEIRPIGFSLQERVSGEVIRYVDLGNAYFGKAFPVPPIRFDLRGATAGMYKVRGSSRIIRFNPWVFAKYYSDSLETTVPHEVAHYLADMVYGLRHIRPHGPEWKAIMAHFGADDSVTTRYSMEGIPRRTVRRFHYRCGCGGQPLTAYRHNRIVRGEAVYWCRLCGQQLEFAGICGTST